MSDHTPRAADVEVLRELVRDLAWWSERMQPPETPWHAGVIHMFDESRSAIERLLAENAPVTDREAEAVATMLDLIPSKLGGMDFQNAARVVRRLAQQLATTEAERDALREDRERYRKALEQIAALSQRPDVAPAYARMALSPQPINAARERARREET